MTSKGKKGKKKHEAKVKTKAEPSETERTEGKQKENAYAFFNCEEIVEIKSILKIKDLGIPFVVGAVILNKFELLKRLIKQGYNVNEPGPNNISALIWAVKYKFLDQVDYLLSKGADPTIKTENGDNVLMVALEHKLWDEQTFINLWNNIKTSSYVDINFTNKNGHSILHIAVRRDWESFINMLITEKVNIDVANVNGVTPLMLACFRNNINIVNNLLSAGANVTREDNHGRMALCYAISNEMKASKPPYILAERILIEHKKHSSFKEYLKRRLDIITSSSEKLDISYASSEMFISIIQFTTQYVSNGVKMLMDLKLFEHLTKALKKHIIGGINFTKFFLTIAVEILFYNDQCIGFSPDAQNNMIESFINSGFPNICLDFLKNEEASNCSYLSFYLLLLMCTCNETGRQWLRENHTVFQNVHDALVSDSLVNFQQEFPDERRLKIMKKKMKKIKRLMSVLQSNNVKSKGSLTCVSDNKDDKKVENQSNNSKKTKRRSKALKAKIAKIKNAELTERLNLSGKKPGEVVTDTPVNLPQEETPDINKNVDKQQIAQDLVIDDILTLKPPEEMFKNSEPCNEEFKNPISYGLLEFLDNQKETIKPTKEKVFRPSYPEWKSRILNLPFDDATFISTRMITDKEKLLGACLTLKQISMGENISMRNVGSNVAIIIEYLNELLKMIVEKYQKYWENDKKISYLGNCDDTDSLPPHSDVYLQYKTQMEALEKQTIEELQKNFDQLILIIKSLASKHIADCYKSLCHLESTLLNFEIRGKSILSDVCNYETVRIKHSSLGCISDPDNFLLNYIEDVLNDRIEHRDDIKIKVVDDTDGSVHSESFSETPSELYYKEVGLLSHRKLENKTKEYETKQKTLQHSYHLYDSMKTFCDCDCDEEICTQPSFKHSCPSFNPAPQPAPDSLVVEQKKSEYSELVLKVLTKHVESNSSVEKIPSRWAERIESIESMKDPQKLLGGDVRISRRTEKRQDHIISHGGNFNIVVLGLTKNNQAVAVKRIPREHYICKVMKSLINPLLGLRHTHILHYYVCDYEDNELILATPLCEFNIGQYVLLMKDAASNNYFNLTPMEIVKQFLTGLMFLHNRKEPIVHGNLKPSNIFVDSKGIVRVAEFGVHKALFKMVEAPKSSLIWFAQETYQVYKQTSVMECTCASDIQVAGMLVYFILSGGVHPYGSNVVIILKNLEKAILNLPRTHDLIFVDIVTWMMMYDPNERPNIDQVLSHVIFWSSTRRWRFVLNCAGINHHGSPLPIEINDLHATMDKMSIQEKIKGSWVEAVRNKFPNIGFYGEDTVTGLLKFIRCYYEQQTHLEIRESDLSSFILNCFPAFPLSLYRILEATNWLKHPIFAQYTVVDPLLP